MGWVTDSAYGLPACLAGTRLEQVSAAVRRTRCIVCCALSLCACFNPSSIFPTLHVCVCVCCCCPPAAGQRGSLHQPQLRPQLCADSGVCRWREVSCSPAAAAVILCRTEETRAGTHPACTLHHIMCAYAGCTCRLPHLTLCGPALLCSSPCTNTPCACVRACVHEQITCADLQTHH